VILLIVYFSMPGKGQQESENKAIVIKAQGRTEMSVYDDPNIPKNFDVTFFKERILKIRKSPNLVHDLFTAWETKFKSRQEKKILREIEDWYKHVKNISEAEAEALMARMDADDAQTDYLTSKTQEYQGARKKRRVLHVQADNADLEARIAEAKRRKEGPKEEPAGKEPQKPKKMTEEEVRQKKVSRFHTVADDEIAMDEAQAQKLRELDEKESKEVGEVENNLNLSQREKQRRLQEIDARYLNLRKKILSTPGGRT
ncbi:MAG: hypothetical protein KKE86_16915, partial [Planctomycetes bacterium]|nr:hypothetical protein [Planctomycetota bacterium]